jgi:hypothetical protein
MRRVVEMFYFIFINDYTSAFYTFNEVQDRGKREFDRRIMTCGIGRRGEE